MSGFFREYINALLLDFAGRVRWRMRHDKNEQFITFQDKYLVKKYAAKNGVNTPEVFSVSDIADDIPFGALPPSCLIKATHGCQWNILRRNGEYYLFNNGSDFFVNGVDFIDKSSGLRRISADEAREICRGWLSSVFSEKEWAYTRIKPKIIAEELLYADDLGELKDYRLYTFNGHVKVINVGSGSYRRNGENAFFDRDWTLINISDHEEKLPSPLPDRPKELMAMLLAAEALASGTDFLRIDFYTTTKGIMLGEMTVYPEGGKYKSPTTSPSFNKWLGRHWRMNRIDYLKAYVGHVMFITQLFFSRGCKSIMLRFSSLSSINRL